MLDSPSAGRKTVSRSSPYISGKPVESLLTRIFYPTSDEKDGFHLITEPDLKTKSPSKKPEKFVAFFNERNKMNKLILVNKS